MFICVGNYKWIITNFQRLLRRLKLRDNICSFSNNTTQGFSFYLSMRARVREKGWLAQRDRENQALTIQRTGNLPGRPLYRVPKRKGRNTQLVRNFQTIFLRVPGIAHRPPTKQPSSRTMISILVICYLMQSNHSFVAPKFAVNFSSPLVYSGVVIAPGNKNPP